MEELADDDDEVELDDFIPPKVERKQSQQTHQTRPSSWSSNDDGIRHSANPAVGHVQDDPHSIALDVDDSVFFTWRSPSQKNQPPVFTQLVVTSEQDDDDTAPMFMRSPSDQMMLHSDVPDIFLTGESSSSFSSYQYTQRENGVPNQDGSKPVPCFDAADSSDIHSHASVSYSSTPCHHRSSYNDDGDSYAEGDDDDNRSFMSAASSNVSGLYIQSESDYSPRSSQQLHFRWDGEESCLHELARTAALALGVPPLRLDNGVRLASQYSLPLLNAADVEASSRIVHVLLDFDLWVWPGIEVNFTYTLHDNMTLTTKSLSPRVLSLANFITEAEANEIIAQGEKYLRRSPTGESVEGTVSDIRTSYTAFLPDTAFSSAAVARLPSPSYAERIQLVRYRPGEFYRQHLDTMSSKNIVTPPIYTYDDFLKWASVAAASLDVLDNESIPDGFRPGQPLYPNGKDVKFARALVELFWNDGVANHFFESRDEVEWEQRISRLGDAVPNSIRPSGKLYPKYDQYFQYEIIRLLFKHHTTAELITLLTKKWYDFLVEYKARRDCIHILLQQVPALAQAVADTWEKEVQMPDGKLSYKLPAHVHHMTPNRFVTLFMYLNAVESGGGTVFPYGSRGTPADVEIPSKGMEECGKGLNVPPTAFGASLFYTQTPDQEVDPLALHGGCPPQGGIKWGSNSFMWNADAGEGSDFWN
ncbi:hypothetical protein DYB32_009199 [Aphanomyces invadans]|uniref:Prolyl 4-hydroxylase alpha subunit domain-containing protein n=1 Tax=Aphanomyces invadans TaxID=157072 RepID=A0A3R6VQY5_9STRA|nr:hypothetical protein DYB32_009199 [Aphanomyces invadans]